MLRGSGGPGCTAALLGDMLNGVKRLFRNGLVWNGSDCPVSEIPMDGTGGGRLIEEKLGAEIPGCAVGLNG